MANVLAMADYQSSCSRCSVSELCLPNGLARADVRRLEALVAPARELARAQKLFSQGEPLHALYVVRSGSMKTVVLDANGLEQIVGFHYPGDLLGLDGIAQERYGCAAVALQASEFCRIPFARLEELTDRVPTLRRRLMRLMSRQLSYDDRRLHGLGRKSSEARLAAWLLDSCREGGRDARPRRELSLSMSRTDLANFLGMRIETVSRILTRMDRDGVIQVRRRVIVIRDFDQLAEWAGRAARIADR